jgi:hypothetical protein
MCLQKCHYKQPRKTGIPELSPEISDLMELRWRQSIKLCNILIVISDVKSFLELPPQLRNIEVGGNLDAVIKMLIN